eukprot:4967807-Amphidinium_carterae.1
MCVVLYSESSASLSKQDFPLQELGQPGEVSVLLETAVRRIMFEIQNGNWTRWNDPLKSLVTVPT